jgi:hypothetical protein
MRFVSVLFSLLPVTLAAFSDPGAGSISGTVRDVSGAAVPGAAVEVRNAQGRLVNSAVSAQAGDYAVQLPPGNYAITVKMKGMRTYAHAYFSIDKATVIREDVLLEVDDSAVSALPDSPTPVIAPVRPPSKDFYAEVGELELTAPSLSLNGNTVDLPKDLTAVKGTVVWIYVPGRGRYLLSLSRHADLGFSLAGQVGGSTLWFKFGADELQLDTDERIAPGSATYNLYALQESDWLPPNASGPATALLGSD